MQGAADKLPAAIRFIRTFSLWAGSLGIIALVGITVVGVFWRYALNDPIFGITDVAVLTAAASVAFAVVFAAVNQAHITIDLINGHLHPRWVTKIDRVIKLASAITLAVAAWALWKKGRCGAACGDLTDNLGILHQPFYWLLSASMVLCAALFIWHALRATPATEASD